MKAHSHLPFQSCAVRAGCRMTGGQFVNFNFCANVHDEVQKST